MKSVDEEHFCGGDYEEGKEKKQALEDHPSGYPFKVLHPDPDPGPQSDIL